MDGDRLDSVTVAANLCLMRLGTRLRSPLRNGGSTERTVADLRGPSLRLDTGIANEKDWGINLLSENINESGTNEDGSTWFRESGEELGENGYRCRWTRMGGQSSDTSSEWKETVWRNPEKMLKAIRGGKHGKKLSIKMNGGGSLMEIFS
ncbi:hypothetical protein Scep_000157 [Stephania cephalantha]|uniref:Uncharacterized protein n=1 Tax=Stephania cephalantha TaxID=152367 RepID=A0AAP0Q6E4_9MAGN